MVVILYHKPGVPKPKVPGRIIAIMPDDAVPTLAEAKSFGALKVPGLTVEDIGGDAVLDVAKLREDLLLASEKETLDKVNEPDREKYYDYKKLGVPVVAASTIGPSIKEAALVVAPK